MAPEFFKHIQLNLKKEIVKITEISGGDISQAYRVACNPEVYFLKCNSARFLEAFEMELHALGYIDSKSSLLVPQGVSAGLYKETSYLVLEYIDTVKPTDAYWSNFGLGLAKLHRNTSSTYGWPTGNYIGSIKQINLPSSSWSDFYHTSRLAPLIKIGIISGKFDLYDERHYLSLVRKLNSLIPEEVPALCHGDLWNGNFIVGKKGPYLIDPSTSYMHREMDIAMCKLFGGFDQSFYSSYNHYFPMEPGFDKRIEIYQLYYLMVHAILFGGTYVPSVKNILKKYGG